MLALALGTTLLLAGCGRSDDISVPILDARSFQGYVDEFNGMVPEGVVNFVPNSQAWSWMSENIPYFQCPDPEMEEIYYYRWWTFRKHLKETPDGFIWSEFIRPVGHATVHNAISCALGHHISEGRWLHDQRYLDQYILFWLRGGEGGGPQSRFHQYSGWVSHAVYQKFLVHQDREYLLDLLPDLSRDFEGWEKERMREDGLFWQADVWDGMEESISGGRHVRNVRPTINSYMYANAAALARIAQMAGQEEVSRRYQARAEQLKAGVQDRLWDPEARFFKTLLESGGLADVREQIGFVPWYVNLPDPGYEEAWRQLMDPEGFFAPFGPTTAEQRHPEFVIAEEGDDCQWNGPSWPFSTSQTLTALANLLNHYRQDAVSKRDYWETLGVYTRSHRLELEDGRVIPWIDENLNPFTGGWQARNIKIKRGRFDGRGDHYNHSSYADLIISGLVGLRPREDDIVEVNPLLPEDAWDWFCLDHLRYHGRTLTILWDRTGEKYGRGRGLQLFADGKRIARSDRLERVASRLPDWDD